MSPLPGALAKIAGVVGEEAALLIAKERGGTQIYIPPNPKPDHWLSNLIGHEAAIAMANELTMGVGGLRLDIPRGPNTYAAQKREQTDRMIAEGASAAEITRATGYTARAIRRRRSALQSLGAQ